MKKPKSGRKAKAFHTSLAMHRKEGSRLHAGLNALPFTPIPWDRDLLPEYLWLSALSERFSIERIHQPFFRLMDIVDEYWPEKVPALGLLSDFAVLQPCADEIWSKHESTLIELFHEPIGRVLALYPESPASWLVREDLIERGGRLTPEIELTQLRRLVVKILSGQGGVVGHLRTLPVLRLLKHRTLSFPAGHLLISILPRYPHATSEEENKLVQSSCRALINALLPSDERLRARKWPSYFWRTNMDLLACRPMQVPIYGGRPVSEAELPRIQSVLNANGLAAREYLEAAGRKHKYDLYDPERDEILFGLLARAVRLYVLVSEDPNLWPRDTGAIMLRCLVDTAITFSYLAKRGSEEDFRKFREYGEGQEKLLMLHLQDSYPEERSLEGRAPQDISEELGGFYPELIEIELGHWAKKDARQLAASVGMERFYRLVYSPASSDLHGTWMSLKHSSLCRCVEPLHRFHRLPAYSQPLAYLGTVDAATQILAHTLAVANETLALLPPPELHLLASDIMGGPEGDQASG